LVSRDPIDGTTRLLGLAGGDEPSSADTRREIRGRPYERTMESVAFRECIGQLDHADLISPSTRVWIYRRFLDELDRRRGLERRWRIVFWLTRYVVLSGTLVLPVLIAIGRSIFWANVAGIIVSIVVALATAMEAVLRSGRKWRLYRQGADRMADEGTAFFQELGIYGQSEPTERLARFKERIESSIRDLHESYLVDIEIVATQNVPSSNSNHAS
jgi:hypothetical protein